MRWIRENLLGDESRRYGDYANQLRKLSGSYSPYTDVGKQSLPVLQNEYSRGLQSPSFLEDQLANLYQASPYEQSEEEHLKRSLANQAAVTGTLGSSYAGKTLADTIHRLLSEDMDKYINRGMQTYQTALSGESAFPGLGLGALGQQNQLNQNALQAMLQGNLSRDTATQKLYGYGGKLFGSALSNYINPSSSALYSGGNFPSGGNLPYGGSYNMSPVNPGVNPMDESVFSYASVPFFG